MRNAVLGSVFFFLLILGLVLGLLFNQSELFVSLGLLFGLTMILIFRKK